jgi:hypothetical protein
LPIVSRQIDEDGVSRVVGASRSMAGGAVAAIR